MNLEANAETQSKFKEADQLFRAKKFSEALVVLDNLDREFPNVKNIIYPRAMCMAHVGMHEEALELCRQLKVEFGDTRADALMTQISLVRKAAMLKEQEKKDHKVVGSVMPPPNVFQLDSSPPPMRDPGDLGLSAFDVDFTQNSGIAAQDINQSMEAMFAQSEVPPVKPASAYRSNTLVYAGIGLLVLVIAIAAIVFVS
jgi:hypothetical protein